MKILEQSYKDHMIRIFDKEYVFAVDVLKILGSVDPARDIASMMVHQMEEFRPFGKLTTLNGRWFQLLSFTGIMRMIEFVPSSESKELLAWMEQTKVEINAEPDERVQSLESEIIRLKQLLIPDPRITREQKCAMRHAVSNRLQELKKLGIDVTFHTLYSELNRSFEVATYTDILAVDFDQALSFCNDFIPNHSRLKKIS